MSASEKDDVPRLSATYSQVDEHENSQFGKFTSRNRSVSISIPMSSMESYENKSITSRNRSVSISIPMSSMESYENESNPVGHAGPLHGERTPFIQMSGPLCASRKHENLFQPTQGEIGLEMTEPMVAKYPSFNGMDQNDWPDNNYAGKNEHLLNSGQLGMCNDPYCTTCPTYYNFKGQQKNSKVSTIFDTKFHNALYEGTKRWSRRILSSLHPYIPGVMNPHAKVVLQWNKLFVISFLVAISLDPVFSFLLSVLQDNKCIVINWPMTTTLVLLRSISDFIYLIHMLLQFRMAYVAPESRVAGAGDLVDDPKKIVLNYLSGYFFIDFFLVLPLPQIIILLVLPKSMGSSWANYPKNLLGAAVLVQYVARLCKFLPMLFGLIPSGFAFESEWEHFFRTLLIFVSSGHVVGSCWYLFGLQRVNQCLRDACQHSVIEKCMEFIDCRHGNNFGNFESDPMWKNWKNNENASACFGQDDFSYGIYVQAVNLTTERSVMTRYVYSLFWGFQQISTLAGNQIPSYSIWESLFTMAIIGLGLLLFGLLIGNMQSYLQALGRRKFEMSSRFRDVEQWMNRRRLPKEVRGKVRESEHFKWLATRGVNEEMLLENLPEDLTREIRRHLFKFVKKVRIFTLLDDPILDAICERLREKTYIRGSKILYRGGLIDNMVFIVRGRMESIGEDGFTVSLSEGDVSGEELLTWCLEQSSVNKDKKIRLPGHRLLSNRMVRCLTNVEAVILRAADLQEVTSLFARFLRNPRVQGAIRYESPYWRNLAAKRIQVAWRYFVQKKRVAWRNRASASNSHSNHWSIN